MNAISTPLSERTSASSLTVNRALVNQFTDAMHDEMKAIKSLLVHMTWQYDVGIEVDHWSYRIQLLDGSFRYLTEEFQDDTIENCNQTAEVYSEFVTTLGNQPERTKEVMCVTDKLDKLAELGREELFQRPLFRD